MKAFYLLRHVDVHKNSGTGVVAEGIIFDNGMCAMAWLSDVKTVTSFPGITAVMKLHSHEGLTEVIIQDQDERFEECRKIAREYTTKKKREENEKAPKNKG